MSGVGGPFLLLQQLKDLQCRALATSVGLGTRTGPVKTFFFGGSWHVTCRRSKVALDGSDSSVSSLSKTTGGLFQIVQNG